MLFEALASGGGSDWYYTVLVKAPVGANITVDDGDEEVTAVGAGVDTLIGIPVHNPSSAYTVSVETDGFTAPTQTVNTPATSGGISTELVFNFATINMTYDDEFRGQTATITDGTHTQTATLPAAPSNLFTVHVPYTGDWRISAEDSVDHQLFYTSPDPIPVTSLTQTINVNMFVIPNGETVLPVNDIETWLACADIKNSGYTTLAEVLADEEVLFKVLTDDNANKYLKRSTDWINEGIIPEMIDATHPSGVVTCSSVYSGYSDYNAFNTSSNTGWVPAQNDAGWIQYQFDNPVKIGRVDIKGCGGSSSAVFQVKLFGSNDGFATPGDELGTINVTFGNTLNVEDIITNNTYAYYRVVHQSSSAYQGGDGLKIQFYPYSEGINDSELAMQIIGADDFASDILLSDATWKSAIFDSAYKEDVINTKVPQMTSDTEPYGEITKISDISTYLSWYAFNDSQSNGWIAYASPNHRQGDWIAYEFTIPNKLQIAEVGIVWRNTCSVIGKIQGYDEDLGQWEDVSNNSLITAYSDSRKTKIDINTNGKTYKKYQFICTSTATSTDEGGLKIQFYGREAGGVQTLLKAAGISKPYTTIDELLADHEALQKVISSHDAIDYLVTAKSFIDVFTSDPTAMRYIGKRNYAANTLLADEDWLDAVANSEYRLLVLNVEVPLMTSNTEPEGVASAISISSYAGVLHDAYMAFMRSTPSESNYRWESDDNTTTNGWVQYEFVSQVKIYMAYFRAMHAGGSQHTRVKNYKMMGSNDNFTTPGTDLTETLLCPDEKEPSYTCGTLQEVKFTKNIDNYKTYRMFIYDTWSNNIGVKTLQFYGRTDVDESYIDIYSAANDSIAHLNDSGNLIPIDTTDSSGKLTIARADLPTPNANGEYDIYSSVAKNPNDLSKYFNKRVKVDADTIELMIMPDDVGYWWGYKGNIEHCETANGWTPQASSYPFISVTWNTQNVTSYTNSAGFSWIGSKKAVKTKEANLIYKGVTYQENCCGELCLYASKALNGVKINENQLRDPQGQVSKVTYKQSTPIECYVTAGSAAARYGRSAEMYALFTEPEDSTPTFLSAAYDILYLLDGARQIPIATTNGEGKSFDLMLAPGTYTIFSSVAKDPSNLSNPYGKTVTIDGSGKTIKIMPDNTLYWYGWKSDEFEVVKSSGIVPAGGTYVDPTYNVNSMFVGDAVSGNVCSLVYTKQLTTPTTFKMLAKGINNAGASYGQMDTYLNTSTAYTTKEVNSATLQYYELTETNTPLRFYIDSYSRRMEVYTVYYE